MLFRQAALLATAILPLSFAQVSEDFEGGWDKTAWPIYAPDCNQGGTVALDSTTAHSGKNSMKVTSPGGFCGHIFFGTTNVPTGDVYVKVWLKATTALTASHVSFITMPDSSQGTGKHLRIGGQNEILMYNRESDDATLPDLSPQGTATSKALTAGTWECFEYHLGTDGSIETWLNSEAIAGLTTANNPNANGWGTSDKPTITGVYFGWESYGGDVNTFWYDDIAVGSTRVGCDGGAASPSSGSTSSAPAVTAPATSASATSAAATSGTNSTAPGTTLVTTVKSSSASSAPSASTSAAGGGTVPLYGQCGGKNWTGGTVCATGTCTSNGEYYSQCLP